MVHVVVLKLRDAGGDRSRARYPIRHGTQAGIAWGKVSVFDKSGIAEAKMFALWEESAGRSLHCVLTHPLTQRLQAFTHPLTQRLQALALLPSAS